MLTRRTIEVDIFSRILLIAFEALVELNSLTCATKTIRQSSIVAERQLRDLFSKLLEKTVLRNGVVLIRGFKYSLPDVQVDSLFVLFPQYEKRIWQHFKPTKGQVFIDVGAHVGKYAFQVARMIGDDGLVVAVEPHPDNYVALLRGIELNGLRNVVPLRLAAWEENCVLNLFLGKASIFHSVKVDAGSGCVEVEARTLDRIVHELNLSHVDWIKLDVEDAEVEVLRGLKSVVARYHPKLILEVQWRNMEAVLQLVNEYGYAIIPVVGEQNPQARVGYYYCKPSASESGLPSCVSD